MVFTQDFYPGLPGRPEPEENKMHMTKLSLLPCFYCLLLGLSLCGRFCWNFFQKNLLTELIGTLDTRRTASIRNIIPKTEDRAEQVKESYEVLMQNLRFYNDYAVYYVLCTGLNLFTVSLQYFFVVDFAGEDNHFFALRVVEFLFENYQACPMEMLQVFPSVAVCHYAIIGPGGNRVPYDYMCTLPWNKSILRAFAFLWFFYLFCLASIIISLVYWVLFLTVGSIREYVVRHTLKLDNESLALQGVRRLNGGALFIILLLNKNVRSDIVCKILGKVSRENAGNLEKYQKGLH